MKDWKLITLIIFVLCISTAALSETSNTITVSNFATEGLNGWKEKSFEGNTRYQLESLDGQTVLSASSHKTASGLFKEIKIDLNKTPYLNWEWRIDHNTIDGDEKTKQGDDYPARIYAVVDGGILAWRTRAINYVWANNAMILSTWPNAYAGERAMMVAVRHKSDPLGEWKTEKRNLKQDFKQLHDKDIQFIDAIAIMTDTDNTKAEAKAYYRNIYFSAQ